MRKRPETGRSCPFCRRRGKMITPAEGASQLARCGAPDRGNSAKASCQRSHGRPIPSHNLQPAQAASAGGHRAGVAKRRRLSELASAPPAAPARGLDRGGESYPQTRHASEMRDIPLPAPRRLGYCGGQERWPSGRRRPPAKRVYGQKPYRGFESHPLRHFCAHANLTSFDGSAREGESPGRSRGLWLRARSFSPDPSPRFVSRRTPPHVGREPGHRPRPCGRHA